MDLYLTRRQMLELTTGAAIVAISPPAQADGASARAIHSQWFMLHRIRIALTQGNFEKLSGTVEADETFIGGKAKNMHKTERERKITGRGAVGKAVVMGILERGEDDKPSRVKPTVVSNTSADVLQGEIKASVVPGSEIMTDAHRGYRGLDADYTHAFVDHAVKYVEGKVHEQP